jgi:hypothetical protein
VGGSIYYCLSTTKLRFYLGGGGGGNAGKFFHKKKGELWELASDFYPSRIPDLGSKNSNKREGWKNFFVKPFHVATNFSKIKIILVLKC